ncbi:MAG: family 78 glycoside hydrolase catalytic domain [Eubacteriales bacterium]
MNNFFINPELKEQGKTRAASYLRKSINITKPVNSAIAKFSACGLYKATINGIPVDNQVFMPGFTAYDKRLQYQEYDVTAKLAQGENVIGVIVGDGWWRGEVGLNGIRNYYGKTIAFLCVLNIFYTDGTSEEIITDTSWKAAQDGAIRAADLRAGETYDATKELTGWNTAGFNDSGWHGVKSASYGGKLVPSEGEKILEHETFAPEVLVTPDGSTVLDFKQNMFGYTQFKVSGKAGQQVTLTHGETLDQNGNFTLKNLGSKTHRFQRIDYILKDGPQVYKPTFSAHGFRYVKLSDWPEKVLPENFKAIAVYSDMEQTGTFVCSNELVNQLVNNVRWSQKSNFLDIPTDCPTRERAGWTGDIGAFAETGSYLCDTRKFLNKWLTDVRAQQRKNGIIPNTVPNVMSKSMEFMNGSSGWNDAVELVPYTLYKMYSDKAVLEDQYECMTRWLEFSAKRAKHTHWLNLFKRGEHRKYIIDTGFHFGEWLEPGHVMSADCIYTIFVKPDDEAATAYFAYSAKLISEIAGILGKTGDEKKYAELYNKIKVAYQKEFIKDGVVKSKRQCRYVRPLALGLIEGETAKTVAKQLNDMVAANSYKIGTGFLTTPWVCNVLVKYGYTDTAFKMLENTARPGWLYPITKGATTIWENWNGIDDNNKPTNSLNHYSPGTVVGWLFNSVAGIKPLEPGFETIQIRPTVGGSITFVNCTYKSIAGLISVSWKLEGDCFTLDIETPRKTEVVLPDGSSQEALAGKHSYSCKFIK